MRHQIIIERVRTLLEETARKRETVFYEDLLANAAYGLVEEPGKSNEIGAVLREISRDEVLNGNPPISAICVRKKEGVPGPEFRSFVDPANQLNNEQVKSMSQFLRDAVYDHFDKRKPKGPFGR